MVDDGKELFQGLNPVTSTFGDQKEELKRRSVRKGTLRKTRLVLCTKVKWEKKLSRLQQILFVDQIW